MTTTTARSTPVFDTQLITSNCRFPSSADDHAGSAAA